MTNEVIIDPEEVLDDDGDMVITDTGPTIIDPVPPNERRKFYVDHGHVEIAAHLVYEMDDQGRQLRVVRYTDYAADRVRTLYPTAAELRAGWANPERTGRNHRETRRSTSTSTNSRRPPSPTPTPSTCCTRVAYNAPLRTRRERADRLRREKRDFFDQHGPEARSILNELLEKCAETVASFCFRMY